MNGLSTRPEAVSDTEYAADAMIRASLRILAVYLLLTAAPLVRWCASAHSWWPLVAHAAALGAAIFFGLNARRFAQPVRDWLPLALGPFLYIELRWIIEGVGRPHADAIVAGWETSLFGSDLSHTLAARWPSLALSEVLHFCYVAYYGLVYVPPALLWVRHRRREFAATVLGLVVVYATCFIVYSVFPVDGPRYLHGISAAPDGPIRAFVLRVLESGSSRGTAFPSSHVAASVVAAICALRFQRISGWIVSGLTVGLTIGAVYGGFHYGVDAVAGALTGICTTAIAERIERTILRSRAS